MPQSSKAKTKMIIEMMLEIWNLMYLHRGNVGEQTHKSVADRIVSLYKSIDED